MDINLLMRDFELLLLLGVSNTMPIVARIVFKRHLETPVDFDRLFFLDRRPVFGPHKTWRGICSSIVGTAFLAWLLGLDVITGMKLAFFSMAGDLIASFIKRRMNLRSGAKATGIDQGIEAFLPLVIMKGELGITWIECLVITIVFTLMEIVLSPIFYRLGFRRHPY